VGGQRLLFLSLENSNCRLPGGTGTCELVVAGVATGMEAKRLLLAVEGKNASVLCCPSRSEGTERFCPRFYSSMRCL
jgi:hypothetical protein